VEDRTYNPLIKSRADWAEPLGSNSTRLDFQSILVAEENHIACYILQAFFGICEGMSDRTLTEARAPDPGP
jgi:hypothetical protein